MPSEHILRALADTDLASMSWAELGHLLSDIRARARASGWADVPVAIENHTKDIGDCAPIERLAAARATADDIEVITLHELAAQLEAGRYPVDHDAGTVGHAS